MFCPVLFSVEATTFCLLQVIHNMNELGVSVLVSFVHVLSSEKVLALCGPHVGPRTVSVMLYVVYR